MANWEERLYIVRGKERKRVLEERLDEISFQNYN